MRSFTLSLVSIVLLFFVAGCSKNNIPISQQQRSFPLIKKSTTAGSCVTYDFSDVMSGQKYYLWNGLTFYDSLHGTSYVESGENGVLYYPGDYKLLIKFPTNNTYYKLSYDEASDGIFFLSVKVYGTNGYKFTDEWWTAPCRYSHSFTAPSGVHLTSIEFYTLDYKGSWFKLYSLELCKVENSCPAPVISKLTASPAELWPPNNKLTKVIFSGNVDNKCGSTTYKLTDEYGDYSYTGTIASGDFSIPLELMASRKGNDTDGRTYTFTVTSENAAGKVVKSDDVIVPHDQRKK